MKRDRIKILDLWRTIAIVLMVIFHFLYDLAMFDFLTYAQVRGFWGDLLSGTSAGLFMIASGVSAHFSRSNLRRGFRLLIIAMALTVVTTIAQMQVRFGILHFLSICMMLYGAAGERKILLKPVTPIVCAVLFFPLKYVTDNTFVSTGLLFPFGFRNSGFYSSDYYPLLPWGLLFIIGIYLGSVIKCNREKPILNKRFPAALTFPGRHSLAIYIIHQPVLLAIVYLLSKF